MCGFFLMTSAISSSKLNEAGRMTALLALELDLLLDLDLVVALPRAAGSSGFGGGGGGSSFFGEGGGRRRADHRERVLPANTRVPPQPATSAALLKTSAKAYF